MSRSATRALATRRSRRASRASRLTRAGGTSCHHAPARSRVPGHPKWLLHDYVAFWSYPTRNATSSSDCNYDAAIRANPDGQRQRKRCRWDSRDCRDCRAGRDTAGMLAAAFAARLWRASSPLSHDRHISHKGPGMDRGCPVGVAGATPTGHPETITSSRLRLACARWLAGPVERTGCPHPPEDVTEAAVGRLAPRAGRAGAGLGRARQAPGADANWPGVVPG
jgi:hypothetical protein